MYGKQTETAISAVGFLAELWTGHKTRRVSAADVADARGLQRPFVAKLLSALSQVGIVSGSPGPGGGYALAKPPSEVRLRDIWLVFERPDPAKTSAAAKGFDPNSPLQAGLDRIQREIDRLLDETTFDMLISEPDTDISDSGQEMGGRLASPSTNGHSLNGHNGATA